MAVVRGTLTAAIFLAVTLVLMPVQLLFVATGVRARARLPVIYHRMMLKLIGVRVRVEGEIVRGPALLASNHTSWLDISVLASVAPLSFIAKREVRSWPLFGQLALLQRTVFVNRERRTGTGAAKSEMEQRFEAGDQLVLFAGGTSDDGNSVLPFRTALFGAAATRVPRSRGGAPEALQVQPVSVAYVRLHGLPMGRLFRPAFAWYGDMEMGPHLWGVFCSGPIDVVVRLHVPVTIDDFPDRKALAGHCEAVVRAGVASAIMGRELRPEDVSRPGPVPDMPLAIAEPAGNR
jgi:1-acyl-sn-glycerol-3-phosphate acyltransferase